MTESQTDIFHDNKYTKAYFGIIAKARIRPPVFRAGSPERNGRNGDRNVNGYYTETHHIIPVSCGGLDEEINLVDLTAREHYMCHRLLPKMVKSSQHIAKMIYALGFMMSIPVVNEGERYIPTSRTIAKIRESASEVKRNNKEAAAKISAAHKGKVLTEDHKAAISAGGLARNFNPSEEHREAISKKHLGIPKSAESVQKMTDTWGDRKDKKATLIAGEGLAQYNKAHPVSKTVEDWRITLSADNYLEKMREAWSLREEMETKHFGYDPKRTAKQFEKQWAINKKQKERKGYGDRSEGSTTAQQLRRQKEREQNAARGIVSTTTEAERAKSAEASRRWRERQTVTVS